MTRTIRPFTPDDDKIIRADYAAYVPTIETARKLGRDDGTLRQRILRLGLRRSQLVSMALKWAPPHLAARAGQVPDEAFLDACYAWRDEREQALLKENAAERESYRASVLAQCAAIDQRTDLSRREKMLAKRLAGMTLDAIGEQHGITRERVRQLTSTPGLRGIMKPRGAGRPPGQKNLTRIERLEQKRAAIVEAEVRYLVKVYEAASTEVRDKFLDHITKPPEQKPEERNLDFFPPDFNRED